MNKFFVFICFVLMANNLHSQGNVVENLPSFDNRLFHYGFYLGINRNDFKLSYKPSSVTDPEITVNPSVGFNVGLIADLRLTKNLNLRFEPGLISNDKVLIFNHITGKNNTRKFSSTYLHLPLVLKFSSNRMDNVRPYILGGFSWDHNFSSNESNTEDNFSGEFRTRTTNFMYEIGLGIDIYLYYFKFSPSIRGVFAINNEVKYDNRSSPWTDPINYLGTRGVFLTFSFE